MTKNRELREECPFEMGTISSLLWIGSPKKTEKISCSLHGHDLFAKADTGSGLNLISLKCAKREGFIMVYVHNLGLDSRKDETPIRCYYSEIDEKSTSEIEVGAKDSDEDEESTGVIFHVIPNLSCGIIVGRSLLEKTDAFNLCPTLRDTSPLTSSSPLSTETSSLSASSPNPQTTIKSFHLFITLCPVSVSLLLGKRKHRKNKFDAVIDAKQEHDNERHAEMFRRSRAEDEMLLLRCDKFKIAKEEEARRIKAWEDGHKECGFCCLV